MIDICALADLPEKAIRTVTAAGKEIAVIRWKGDSVYAIKNRCPHQGAALSAGRLRPKLVGASTDRQSPEIDGSCPVIACAWHGWEFDVQTGSSEFGIQQRIATYPVQVKDGRVLIQLGDET